MKKSNDTVLLIAISLMAIVFFIMGTMVELGVAWGIVYLSVVLLSYRLSHRRYIVVFAFICSALTLIGFFLAPPGGELWKVIANRLLSLFTIGVTAWLLFLHKRVEVGREQVIRDLEEARSRIKVLSGHLPTCANCRKIRDEAGTWKRMEVYISEHSEAEFSHGLCPACAKALYPEQYKTMYGKDNP